MALKEFKFIDSPDKTVNKVQQNITTYLDQLNPTTLHGNYLTKYSSGGSMIDITVGTTTVLIPHGLGRKLQGWQLTDIQADARVWRDTSSTADLNKFLPLKASATAVISLWVF